MGRRAFIIGAGQIGRATAAALAETEWEVTLASRTGDPVEGAAVLKTDVSKPGALARAISHGADLLVDTIAFDAGDADRLLDVQANVTHIVAISSASVYRDARGRTLDEAAQNGFPELPDPINEEQPTVAPGAETYSTRKVAMEQSLLEGAQTRATVLRAVRDSRAA